MRFFSPVKAAIAAAIAAASLGGTLGVRAVGGCGPILGSVQEVCAPTSPPLPSGVTLQAIDGGSNYYCSNGFTNACNDGWDNPSFVPIVDDFAFNAGNSTSTFKSLGLNSDIRVTGGSAGQTTCASGATDLSTLKSAGIQAVLAGDSNCNVGTETVGAHVEEPSDWTGINTQASTLGGLFGLSGRFLQGSFTWNQIYFQNLNGSACGGSGTMTMQEVMTCTTGMPSGRHLNIATDDIYWFAGQNDSSAGSSAYGQYYCGLIYSQGANCTAAQTAEGSHYGDMVDTMRNWVNGGTGTGAAGSAPSVPYIESDDGLLTIASAYKPCASNPAPCDEPVKPNELSWAVWDSVVHGARMLLYFGTTTQGSCTGGFQFGFCSTPQSGQTVSDATQATDTNTLVENLAPIINSPFALNFASDNSGGYTFPTPAGAIGTGSQLDIMSKYYSGGSFSNSSGTFGNGFYIFVTGRGQETATSLATTITLPSSDTASGTVNVIDASTGAPSTTTATVSSHQISLTLPHAYDTYIIGPIQ